ncbi:MAG TPA: DUF1707 domain-containing protein [Gemmatimonadales bacterium]|nr:DUF1707 domain-containing protein [Gemmatimonadales bacterium]
MDEMELLREEAIRALSAALASDRLSFDQFESRLALIRQAPNRATIDAILADLPADQEVDQPTSFLPLARDHTAVAGHDDLMPVEPAEVLRIRTVMGSSKRAGSWTVPFRLELKVVLGELTIDLRDAVFCSDTLDIDLNVLMGSLTLIVPAGTQVENESEEKFSSTSHSTRSTQGMRRIGLLIRITGRVHWSSFEIKEKPPSGMEPRPRWMRLLAGE